MATLLIHGVPDKIARADWVAMLDRLGLNAAHVQEFTATREGIKATVYAQDEQGNAVIDGDRLATHEVYIRVV